MVKQKDEPKQQTFLSDLQDILLTVDNVVLSYVDEKINILLIRREHPPYEGQWALPGGFVKTNERLEEAAVRDVKDETGLQNIDYVVEIGTFDKVERDPRRRIVSVAYLIPTNRMEEVSAQSTDYLATRDAKWWPLEKIPEQLAFDHTEIVIKARKVLQKLVLDTDVAKYLMGEKFTLTELQTLYEKIHGIPLEKRNFRKQVTARGYLTELDEMQTGSHRPARLYHFR